MSGYTPTTEQVRERFVDGFPMDTWATSRATCGAQFDRWLAEHDHAVLVEYEKRRKPDPIHIDNIDSLHAATWLAEHDAEVKAQAWDEGKDAEREFQNRPRGEWWLVENPYRKGAGQ